MRIAVLFFEFEFDWHDEKNKVQSMSDKSRKYFMGSPKFFLL